MRQPIESLDNQPSASEVETVPTSGFVSLKPERISLNANTHIVKRAEYQHYLHGQAIIADAREEAEAIIQSAEAAREQERQIGFQEGVNAGKQAQSEAMLETLQLCERFMLDSQQDIADMVMQVTRKVLSNFDNEALVLQMTQQALALNHNARKVILHISPEQVTYVNARLGQLMKDFPDIGEIDVMADERIEPGGCLLETSIGLLDATLDNQLAAIASSMRKSLARSIESTKAKPRQAEHVA